MLLKNKTKNQARYCSNFGSEAYNSMNILYLFFLIGKGEGVQFQL